uniref:Uncharacterized protein n=1 Tax=Dreissena rostriformis TaxID=205083 RepID=A0A894JNJ7_9BIVA|nr:hypothetical protein K8L31_mgp17 [Dreissena rostriformis]QRV59725.1 hypothetical protein [Dreissena rostriformis]
MSNRKLIFWGIVMNVFFTLYVLYLFSIDWTGMEFHLIASLFRLLLELLLVSFPFYQQIMLRKHFVWFVWPITLSIGTTIYVLKTVMEKVELAILWYTLTSSMMTLPVLNYIWDKGKELLLFFF